MTQEDYRKAYKLAHAVNGKLSLKTQKELLKVFIEAGELVSAQVKKATTKGLSDLTSSAWKSIEKQLEVGANLISSAVEKAIPLQLSSAYNNLLNIDVEYIMDAVSASSVDNITLSGIQKMGVAINTDLLNIQATRVFSDGYTFSERVWNNVFTSGKFEGFPNGVFGDYQYRIKNLILTGQAQGRDIIKIADDIQEYITKGKDYVFKESRYGKLIPGTGEYKRRISTKVDWRAIRLVRSETNASLQQAGDLESKMNPASLNLVDWIKTAGNPLDQDGTRNSSGLRCIDLERLNPWTLEESPEYQHANCSCQKIPVLMDEKQFVEDLESWTLGHGPDYLDDWYTDQYLVI